jgi:hypothetical protein
MRCFLLLMLLVSAGASASDNARGYVFHDMNGNGTFDDGESGVEGVTVSNGREVVATDALGQYGLPVCNDTILFVIKPRGWSTALDADGISRGYYIHTSKPFTRVRKRSLLMRHPGESRV